MNTKTHLGFCSRNITSIISVIIAIVFVFITSYTLVEYSTRYRNSILKQTSFVKKRWAEKISVFSYFLRNNFLPQLQASINNSELKNQAPLLSKFKTEVGFSAAIEDIILLNPNFDVEATATKDNKNSYHIIEGISLKDRSYLTSSQNSHEDVYYGEPVISEINRKLFLPIGVPISKNGKIKGYIILCINLDNLYSELFSDKISESLKNISFGSNNLGIKGPHIVIKEIEQDKMLSFLRMCFFYYKYKYHVVEVEIADKGKIYFIYDVRKVFKEFLIALAERISLCAVLSCICFILYKLYTKYLLKLMFNLHDKSNEVRNRFTKLLNNELFIPKHTMVPEARNIKDLELLNNELITQLESYYLIFQKSNDATKLALECSSIALEILYANSNTLNEVIEDSFDYLNSHKQKVPNVVFTSYFNDLSNISESKIQTIEIFKTILNNLLSIIEQGKEEIFLIVILDQIEQEYKNQNINIKLLPIDNFLHENKFSVYAKPFYDTLSLIITYIRDVCNDSCVKEMDLSVRVEHLPKEDKITIHFIAPHYVTTTELRNCTIIEAKMYALFNAGIITDKCSPNFYMLSVTYIGIKSEQKPLLLSRPYRIG